MSTKEDFSVVSIKKNIGAPFIKDNHYTKGVSNAARYFGLFYRDDLIGVIAYANPCSEDVRSTVYGPDRKHEVTEFHRMVILDEAPRLN